MSWSEIDDDTARQAEEAEAVWKPLIAQEFGEDAILRRDHWFGDYRLFWTRQDLGKACESGQPNVELYLFNPEDTTTHAMLWSSIEGFDMASQHEMVYLSDTPLSLALTHVAGGVLDYIKAKWEQAE